MSSKDLISYPHIEKEIIDLRNEMSRFAPLVRNLEPDSREKKDEIESLVAEMLQAGPSQPWTLCQPGSISQEKGWELAFLP